MKKIIITIFTLISLGVVASTNIEDATAAALVQAKMTFRHLGSSLKLEVVSTNQIDNKVFVEVSIGTSRRPDRMRNCFIATFEDNGVPYIANLEQHWDENCPQI